MFEDGKITIDEITPVNKYGLLFKNDTKWTSASVGKVLFHMLQVKPYVMVI